MGCSHGEPEALETVKNRGARVAHPSTASYTPDPFYSTGGATSITRLATGVYTVRWPEMDPQILQAGHVQVTAYGSGNAQCKVTGWGSTSADVLCFAPNGAPVDSYYTVLLGS